MSGTRRTGCSRSSKKQLIVSPDFRRSRALPCLSLASPGPNGLSLDQRRAVELENANPAETINRGIRLDRGACRDNTAQCDFDEYVRMLVKNDQARNLLPGREQFFRDHGAVARSSAKA